MDRAAIVGVGMTRIEAQKPRETFADMAFEAVSRALDDAGMTIGDIDNVVTTSSDFWDGRTISCMAVGDASGAATRSSSCVEGDGTFGALYGLSRTLSGPYRTTLVTAHSKGSQSVSSLITNAAFDPIYERGLGMDMLTACALQASAYIHRTGLAPEATARVSVKNHGNARRNPLAQLPLELTVEEVLGSEMIADPLRKLDCSPISDGCAAVILAHESIANKWQKPPVWVQGAAMCADHFFFGDRDLSRAKALTRAAHQAYQMAGVKEPRRELDVVELYDAFSYQELLWLEALELADDGQAGALLARGEFDQGGRLPVNPSGGLLSGHPVIAAGLYRLAEVVLQLRGEAGAHQVPQAARGPAARGPAARGQSARGPAARGLAHGVNGLCGQSHCVFVLGR